MKCTSKTETKIEFDFSETERKVLEDFRDKIDMICDDFEENTTSVVIGHYSDYDREDFIKFSCYLNDLLEK